MILLVLSGSDLLSERVALSLDDFGSSSCGVPALCASGSLSAVFPLPAQNGEASKCFPGLRSSLY